MSHQLTKAEQSAIVFALRVAAEEYRRDRDMMAKAAKTLSTAERRQIAADVTELLDRQITEARRLADTIEQADYVEL